MPRVRTEQQRFSKGEIDPLMIARGDVDQYYGGSARALNVWPLRQGGYRSRPGLEYIGTLPAGKHKLLDFIVDAETKYLVAFSNQQINIFRDGVLKATLSAPAYPNDKIERLNWEQSYDTMILFNDTVRPHRLFRQNETTWTLGQVAFKYIPRYAFTLAQTNPQGTLTPSEKEGEIKLTSSVGCFTAESVGQYIEGNGGRARITSYVSATVVKAVTEIAFFDNEAIAAGEWTFYNGYEDAWSDTRGWPTSGVFYENRLWIGGCLSVPNGMYASRVNDFFNFNPGTILDDDAITAQLSSANKITNVLAGRNLQVFTIGSEHIAQQSLGDPITPKTVNFKQQTSIGSKPHLRVFEIEGATIFTNKSSIHEFVYDDTQGAYKSDILSLLSGHLVKNPIDFTVRKSYTDQGATYIAMVNEDHNLVIVDILRSQDVNSFAEQTTGGRFLNCGTDENDIYVIVERVINGQTVHYLERFNDNHMLDCSVIKNFETPSSVVTGLSHLEGQTVCVVADGSVMEEKTVTNGQITLERPASVVEVGFNFRSEIKDLPFQTPRQGTTLGYKKNVSEVVVELFETTTCHINGKPIVFKQFGPSDNGSPLDKAPPVFTGCKKLVGFRGWDMTGQITISKEGPGRLTLLSISKKVNY